jgi:hypothetical protein
MPAVHRTLKSTQRKRITRDRVSIELLTPEPPRRFTCATVGIDLSELALDADAQVVLEGYYRSSSMRFSLGTVGQLRIPESLILSDIDKGGAIQFRLFVVATDGSGRIIAAAHGVRPRQQNEDPESKPLLPLQISDTGEQLWKVEVNRLSGATLIVNSRVPDIQMQLRSSPFVQGLILPHALRAVLRELTSENAEGEDWVRDWRAFLESIGVASEPEDDDPDSQDLWIEEAVERFCEAKRFVELVRESPVRNSDSE